MIDRIWPLLGGELRRGGHSGLVMAKVDKSDPFPSLDRPRLFRDGAQSEQSRVMGEFAPIEPESEVMPPEPVHGDALHQSVETGAADQCDDGGPVAQPSEPEPAPKIERAQAALDEATKKIGRPKRADKPWEAEGISRSLFYRREKAKREAGE
jgi:hypothetical protein